MNQTYSTLLSMIHTVYDRDSLLHELNVLAEHLFQTEQSTRDAIRLYVSARYAAELQHLCVSLGIGPADSSQLKALVDGLTDELSHMKELQLRVAFDPNEDDIQALSQWVRFHVGVPALLNVTYDKTVTGGAIISYGGIYRDYSLSTQIDEHLARESVAS